ncbi:ABC transporter ATP-binding protein [Cryobacterium melibiosiphilum]|uniref:ABC transporter ATP-binding protein n=1 Tax=Cryobacterium melibiosiphilum TaxID=995039 RepID=A0A3A5MKN2_9MICO|nr:ABC transporter ATP-binding protein [Cryobacterium melibiosiphilum]RJT89605.1 ABC transporter ATP-binding protein [Cryobacterium melibiosiphilum]
MTGISIRNLRLELGGKKLLDGVTLDAAGGQITGLAGESGSGKTLTGMALLGLLPEGSQLSGQILYAGTDLVTKSQKQLNQYRGTEIALVFQDPAASMHPMISIGEQLTDHMRYHLKLSRKQALARAVQLLQRVKVPDPEQALTKYPHQFSGGQLQRIAIAGAIACEPKILIADEPTTALDVTVQAGIMHLLRELCDSLGLTIVLITHDLGVMSGLADNIAVMRNGRVIEFGSRFDVIRNPQQEYTRSLIESLPNFQKGD